MADDLFNKVRSILVTTFRIPSDTPVSRETTSSDVDGWDSLSHSLLVMNVEEAFGVDLPFDRVYELQNVGELVDLVRDTLPVASQS